ncbi:uncharacterized protein yc1106_07667 [Curvularia clavata]|uniref:Uncharacterized protein n=1 Tax=Curvularia clavata TaxID=95742 RepID=A0A9Q9DTZ7_CURCL|nr:uncharacterized protein yc1106_07667 [Curvularia clavata]
MPRTPEIKRESTIEADGNVSKGLAPPRVAQIPKDFTKQKQEKPTSILNQFDPDTRLKDNKPYIEGYDSNEYEEEVNNEDKIIDENEDGYSSNDSFLAPEGADSAKIEEAEDQDEEAEEEKSK